MSQEIYLVAEFERTGCEECGYPIRYSGAYTTLEKALADNKNQQITVYKGQLDKNFENCETILEHRFIKTITEPIQVEHYTHTKVPEYSYEGRSLYLVLGQENEELNGFFIVDSNPSLHTTHIWKRDGDLKLYFTPVGEQFLDEKIVYFNNDGEHYRYLKDANKIIRVD
jgi:hypothetical protein